jgi:organic radical activating enzyme
MTVDTRIYIPKIEFYITNVCNLTCKDCNRYNNYNFKGWQDWEDYKDIYAEWAKKIDIKHIVLLGGEPLLNPSICDWILGIKKLWPRGNIQIVTNGTHLNLVPNLYDTLRKSYSWVQVSIHNTIDVEKHILNIKQFLKEPIRFSDNKKELDEQGMSTTFGSDYGFLDSFKVKVGASIQDSFYNISIHTGNNGKLTLHNNDPELAHKDCGFVKYKNYHFIRGKLYKCGPVALMPEFDQQYPLDISDEDRVLLNNYRPLSINEFEDRGADFINNIDNVIDQCKFCPTTFSNTQIFATNKNKNSIGSFKIVHK